MCENASKVCENASISVQVSLFMCKHGKEEKKVYKKSGGMK